MAKGKGQSKGGKPGGGGGGNSSSGSKKSTSSTTNNDDAFIVFTNSDKDIKRKPNNTEGGSKSVDPNDILGEAPKKPSAKQLIGGASWTGKLPLNMLAEHCQKQKWEKPEYTMSRTPEGHLSMTILKAINPKTKEVETIRCQLPPEYKHLMIKPTALEARHTAATYALFRVCSMRNIHMMLPPDHRDLWKGEFEVLKKQDVKDGKAWMYEADPFQAARERQEAKDAMEKRRAEQARAREAAQKMPGAPGEAGLALRGPGGGTQNIHRGWTKVPKIEMGKKARANVERLIRKHALWNPHDAKMSVPQKQAIIRELRGLDFRESHIEEAVEICKDREETLEWLLIHVPEDDLPKWALPESYVAGISMGSSDLKKEGVVKRLAEGGFATDLCKQVLDLEKGDEAAAAEHLQNILLNNEEHDLTKPILDTSSDWQSSEEIWAEEITGLESVFGDNFERLASDVCKITIKPNTKSRMPPLNIDIHVRRSKDYPHTIPIVNVIAPLPSYIRLSIMRRSLLHLSESCLGEPMVFFLIDWIDQNIYSIIDRPGKLGEVSAAASTVIETPTTQKPTKHSKPRHPRPIQWIPNPASKQAWLAHQNNPKLQAMLRTRTTLPAWEQRDHLISTVQQHQVTIISGETGSGKSTQSAQFILDDLYARALGDAARIICTQPRRISAIGLADRVADERAGSVGDEVGYIIRGEARTSPRTKITFVTTGVLLRRLQTSGGSTDDVVASLADVSHVIIDEVHERSLDTDFLLILLRDVLRKRKDLKLILMSATLDADIFENYFKSDGKVGRVEISGRTYPVEDYYLDDIIRMTGFNPPRGYDMRHTPDEAETDGLSAEVKSVIQNIGMRINYDLITETVREIDADLTHLGERGGILIFMPGTMEISRCITSLRSLPNLHVLPLHASLLSAEQRRVFPHAPMGLRKVIVATNVAETSITIDDIVAVIDTGKVKETSYDPQNNMRKLEEVWASRAACKQRRGRAGRVQAGKCYKLYTRNAERVRMAERPEPEIRRVPLEQLCLSVRAMGIKAVAAFLASAPTTPETLAVEGAMDLLSRMGCLDGDDLTALGRHLSMIPADLRCGKLMIYGAMFSCLDACIIVASILTVKSPFVSPLDKREEAKAARSKFCKSGQGDLVGDLQAFLQWDEMHQNHRQSEVRAWCGENFLSYQTLSDIATNRSQFLSSLQETGFISQENLPSLNTSSDNMSLLRSLIAGAFNPQIARIDFPDTKFAPSVSGAVALDPEARTIKYFNQENGRVFVHPSSSIFDAKSFPGAAAFMSYFNKMATAKVFIRDLTPFNAYTALLFSGPISLDTLGRGLVVDGWLRFRGWARIGVLVSRLRGMLDDVLAQKIDDPQMDLANNEVVRCVERLVALDGLDQ